MKRRISFRPKGFAAVAVFIRELFNIGDAPYRQQWVKPKAKPMTTRLSPAMRLLADKAKS
jgi:hypothetical protein